ncbi:zinc-binding alcohol dehydrogenase family protein [Lunatimonas lonarensis]|nr:zinc-binding alcohol dehydrogenase family protein [Lunatimonas lonarensis]
MHYIVCETPGKLVLTEKEVPVPQPGEVLVRIKKVGICGTDIHAFAGNQAFFTYPRILGHELAGEVADPNGQAGFNPGDKVAIIPYVSCGSCIACRAGKTNCCSTLKVYGVHTDGGMQEYFSFPAQLLLPAPDLSLEEIAIIEPLCIGYHAVQRAQFTAGETVLIMGCGPIGLAMIRFATLAGARVIAVDVNAQRLEKARSRFGADEILVAGESLANQVSELTGGELCPVVMDATGNKQALESGLNYLAHGGRYLLVGLYKGDLAINHPTLHAKEGAVMSSRNATKKDFAAVMELLRTKQFPVEAYVTHEASYDEMISKFEHWTQADSQVIKAMVSF